MRYDALARENAELRGLRAALPPVVEHWLPAEIINVELNSLRQRVAHQPRRAQRRRSQARPCSMTTACSARPRASARGARKSSCHRPGARRSGASGTHGTAHHRRGHRRRDSLALPYLPANADVKAGDLLVTSGLGGVFPAGYPVARITEVRRDSSQPLAQVRAQPLAHIERDREVMLVWFRAAIRQRPTQSAGGDRHRQPRCNPAAPPPAAAATRPCQQPTPAAGPCAPAAGAPNERPATAIAQDAC